MPRKAAAAVGRPAGSKVAPVPYKVVGEPEDVRFSAVSSRRKGHYLRAIEELAQEGGALQFELQDGGIKFDYLTTQLRNAVKKLNAADPDATQYELQMAMKGRIVYVRLDLVGEPPARPAKTGGRKAAA